MAAESLVLQGTSSLFWTPSKTSEIASRQSTAPATFVTTPFVERLQLKNDN
jgi:hypothetical protein